MLKPEEERALNNPIFWLWIGGIAVVAWSLGIVAAIVI